jgi:hypothetical protein
LFTVPSPCNVLSKSITILRWILERERKRERGWDVMDWLIWIGIGTSGRRCEHGNETSGSVKCWEILWVAAELAASQEGLSSMKLVTSQSNWWEVQLNPPVSNSQLEAVLNVRVSKRGPVTWSGCVCTAGLPCL